MTRKRKRRSSVVEIGTGPAKIRIYTINRKDGYNQFTLAWKEGGRRKTRCLSCIDEAKMTVELVDYRLVRPDVLSNLKPSSITALLSPFADYFAGRGAPLTQITSSPLTMQALVSVIASPVESTPPELVERLDLLDLIANPQSAIHFEEGYETLVKRLRDDTDTIHDVAVKILLHAPEIAWREFDRQALQTRRSLAAYSHHPSLKFMPPTAQRIAHLEDLLRLWFQQNARSGICHIHVREESVGTSFVIRHGDLLKRIDVFEEDGCATSEILRPERVDIAHYRHFTGEWQISGIGRRLQELYRQAFGTVFHASSSALVQARRNSLEPLREGPSILRCDPASTRNSLAPRSSPAAKKSPTLPIRLAPSPHETLRFPQMDALRISTLRILEASPPPIAPAP